MSISNDRVSYLLNVYSEGNASNEEEQELFTWVAEHDNEQLIKKHIEELVSSYSPNETVPNVDWDLLYQKVVEEKNSRNIQPVVRKMAWTRWAAAAAVLLLLGTGYYFFTITHHEKQKELTIIDQPKQNDIAPPNTVNAVLTLSNGQKIILDSTGNGTVAMQGSVNVIKLADGQIAYSGTSNEIQYNTLTNPKGSKVISLTLADGSRVWLNTASSLRYPTAFAGKERKVEITGEAYLEVAHNPDMPFIVSKGSTNIKVLGTHFNVNAYDDENSLNVTLLEGSVSVMAAGSSQSKVIKPGEQARVNKKGAIELTNSIDMSEVMAWKNGLFSFKGADIKSVMRQVSRWYDVEVVFEKDIPEKFYAEVPTSTSVSALLNMLEATKAVKFKIEGKTINVMSVVSP
ncbi:MAG: FecR domain-containing protein [Ginsengibacter sp.]